MNESTPSPKHSFPQLVTNMTGPFAWCHFLGVVFLVFLAYGYPSTLLSLNADDVIQIQPASNDTTTFLSLGRWGYYFVFEIILKASPGGWAATFLGSLALCFSGWIMSQELHFKSTLVVSVFIGLTAVSLPNISLFSFDSTRLAYPIGVLFAVYAISLVRKYRVWSVFGGFLLLIAAPSFYPASLQVAVTFIILIAIANFSVEKPRTLLASLIFNCLVVLVAGIVYSWLNQFFQKLFGIWPNPRVGFDLPLSFSILVEKLLVAADQTLPSFLGLSYGYPKAIWLQVLLWVFAFLFLYSLSRRIQCKDWALDSLLLVVLVASLLVAPMSLSLIAPSQEQFPPRTMIAIPVVYAFWIAYPLERFSSIREKLHPKFFKSVYLVFAVFPIIYLSHNLLMSNIHAYDEFLATQEDLFKVNRITASIEQRLGETMDRLPDRIPLVVIGGDRSLAGPRGRVGSARFAGWSREWIFRFTDRRFDPLSGNERGAIVEQFAAGPTWPHPDSIDVLGETVIVRLP